MKSFKRKYSQTFFKQLVAFLRKEAGTKDLEIAYYSDYEYTLEDIFSIGETEGCCGVTQIYDLNVDNERDLMLALAFQLNSDSLIKYYSVDPKYTTSLKKFGFKVDRTFVNKNSGATITELSYDSVSQGDWWWPTLNDIYLALPALRPTPARSIQTDRNTVSPVKTTNRR